MADNLERFLGTESSGGGDAAPAAEQPAAPAVETGTSGGAVPAQTEAAGVDSEPQDFDPNDPAEKSPQQRAGLRKAAQEERKKRQETERRLAQLEGELRAYQQLQSQPGQQSTTTSAPSDPDAPFYEKGPSAYLKEQVGAVEKSVEAVRLELSEEVTRSQHEDYDEVMSPFLDAVSKDPGLLARFQAHAASDPRSKRNPARFAYDYAKSFRDLAGVKSVDELRAKIEADLRPKIEAELRKKGALAAAENASTSSAGARGSGAVTSPVSSGETPIGAILRGEH